MIEDQETAAACKMVFVDAFLPEDGHKTLDLASDFARNSMLEAIAKGEIASPAPAAVRFAVNERDRTWVDAMLTPQPLGVSTQPIKLSGLRERVAKKSYNRAAQYQQPSSTPIFAPRRPIRRGGPTRSRAATT